MMAMLWAFEGYRNKIAVNGQRLVHVKIVDGIKVENAVYVERDISLFYKEVAEWKPRAVKFGKKEIPLPFLRKRHAHYIVVASPENVTGEGKDLFTAEFECLSQIFPPKQRHSFSLIAT